LELSDKSPINLQPWRSGMPIEAAHLDEVRDAVQRIIGGTRPGRQVRGSARASGVTPIQMQVFVIPTTTTDYIWCYRWDGTEQTGEAVRVAVPYLLRSTPFDGHTRNGITYDYDFTASPIERTATNVGAETEDQVIVPSFQVDDIIYAIASIDGGTDVRADLGDGTYEDVTYLMLADGRAWSKKA